MDIVMELLYLAVAATLGYSACKFISHLREWKKEKVRREDEHQERKDAEKLEAQVLAAEAEEATPRRIMYKQLTRVERQQNRLQTEIQEWYSDHRITVIEGVYESTGYAGESPGMTSVECQEEILKGRIFHRDWLLKHLIALKQLEYLPIEEWRAKRERQDYKSLSIR